MLANTPIKSKVNYIALGTISHRLGESGKFPHLLYFVEDIKKYRQVCLYKGNLAVSGPFRRPRRDSNTRPIAPQASALIH